MCVGADRDCFLADLIHEHGRTGSMQKEERKTLEMAANPVPELM